VIGQETPITIIPWPPFRFSSPRKPLNLKIAGQDTRGQTLKWYCWNNDNNCCESNKF